MSKTETDNHGLIDRGDLHEFMSELEVHEPADVESASPPPQQTTEGFVQLVDFIKRKKKPAAHRSLRAIAILRYRTQRDLFPTITLDDQESGPVADGAEVLEDSIKSQF